jgi:HPt (histidine-containing phosphotransfer) domain-containing protein
LIIEELMKQLKLEYVASLLEKRAKISELFKNNQLVELETEFHKMKGSGKTYGLAEVSQFGEIFESICMDLPSALSEVMPLALELIDEIYRVQNLNQSFDIIASKQYIYLKSLLTASAPIK